MAESLKQAIKKILRPQVDVVGFAPVSRFDDTPEAHYPARVCKDAKTVIVLGIPVPQGMLRSPGYNLYGVHRTYHSAYTKLDHIALSLSNFIEAKGKYLAMPIPSYAPMVFHQFEPWGVMSLKHAAVKAGLGRFGRSGQMYHPKYGSLLRLAAVVTSAPIPGDKLLPDELPCPPNCKACIKVCPAKAFDENGKFNKMTCLAYSVKHAIYPLALNSEEGRKKIERVINTAGHNYWIDCDECVKVCPLNKKEKAKKNTKQYS
ncbi:MAG: 4Fe-4S double cluster binding domain-containing protein [Smithellaceae bacterium]|jgi:epoxyqueuosine reductase QueG|nr:epoxyqueuosine reductase [Syntrophaceae bacterium]MBP8608979.1 epoxyqueuosine reductase [Syntrophaceae bacterium]NMD05303.1 epoxyqueuosine reductase [Deltaproteobacteria bacterium]